MGLFSRLLGKTGNVVTDPLFGELRLDDRMWHGKMRWKHDPHPFSINIHQVGAAPGEAEHRAFEALCDDYRMLMPDLQGALYALWKPHESATELPPPGIATSLDLWARLDMQGMVIEPDVRIKLLYGFPDEGWPAGVFIVAVTGNAVEGVTYDE